MAKKDEYIVQFMTRHFEKSIDLLMLSDKNFVVPKHSVIDYVKNALAIPYSDFLDYIKGHIGIIEDDQLTQSSSFAACSCDMCKALERQGNPGMSYVEIGKLFPQYVKASNNAAFRKYGENQIKTSTQLGLTFEYYGCWYLTCVGYIYNELDTIQQESLLARTILRIPLYQAIMIKIMGEDVDLTSYMQSLSASTKGRRSRSILRMANLCLNECRKERIPFHNLDYPTYNARTKTLSIEKQVGTYYNNEQILKFEAPQDMYINYNKVGDKSSYNSMSPVSKSILPIHQVAYNVIDNNEVNRMKAAETDDDYLTRMQTMNRTIHYFNYEQCFAHYTNKILCIRQAKINGEVIVAKPVLLLALIDGIDNNIFVNNKFVINEWLETKYNVLMAQYAKNSQFEVITGIEKPFWHLETDGFWHLNCPGEHIHKSRTPSKAWLKENVEAAYFDEPLWILLQNKEWRMLLRDYIVEHKLIKS